MVGSGRGEVVRQSKQVGGIGLEPGRSIIFFLPLIKRSSKSFKISGGDLFHQTLLNHPQDLKVTKHHMKKSALKDEKVCYHTKIQV